LCFVLGYILQPFTSIAPLLLARLQDNVFRLLQEAPSAPFSPFLVLFTILRRWGGPGRVLPPNQHELLDGRIPSIVSDWCNKVGPSSALVWISEQAYHSLRDALDLSRRRSPLLTPWHPRAFRSVSPNPRTEAHPRPLRLHRPVVKPDLFPWTPLEAVL